MKYKILVLVSFILFSFTNIDISPNPIEAKGIYPAKLCKIRMESEIVKAELHTDYATIDCTFEMMNYGEEISLEVGFPVMDFHYWQISGYRESDKSNFKIIVDNKVLTEQEIKVPMEMDSIYKEYMKVYAVEKELVRKSDSVYTSYNVIQRENGTLKFPKGCNSTEVSNKILSLYDWRSKQPTMSGDLMSVFDKKIREGKYPWYVWNVRFKENEHKTIKVSYRLPSGMSYAANYRYFKYLLNTGAGWYKDIGKAEIILKLNNIDLNKVEKIAPPNYTIDKKNKTIKWNFINLEPTKNDDIYLQYYLSNERKKYTKKYVKRKH